jgi:hypothetical protein
MVTSYSLRICMVVMLAKRFEVLLVVDFGFAERARGVSF